MSGIPGQHSALLAGTIALVLAACDSTRASEPSSLSIRQVLSAGEGQGDTVLAVHPFHVVVLRDNAPMPGVQVSWRVADGFGGTLSPSTSTTDASGIASVGLTLGPLAYALPYAYAGCRNPLGPYSVTATASISGAGPASIVLPVIAGPGTPTRIAARFGNSQVGLVNTMAGQLGVTVTDAYSNPVPGVTIDWAVTAGGGSITSRSESKMVQCAAVALADLTLGPNSGVDSVTATAASVPDHPRAVLTASAVAVFVTMEARGFLQDTVIVPRGSIVGWTWPCEVVDALEGCFSAERHSVTFEDDPSASSLALFGPAVHTRTFNTPGTFRYRCTVHSQDFQSGDVGVVIVQ